MHQYIAGETLDWSRLGYVQIAKDHMELCSALMLLADVHRMKSPAKKILLFPRTWLATSGEDEYDAQMSTTRRLLRTAARRYGVSLIPMETIVHNADGEQFDTLQTDQLLTMFCSYRIAPFVLFIGQLVLSHEF